MTLGDEGEVGVELVAVSVRRGARGTRLGDAVREQQDREREPCGAAASRAARPILSLR